MHRGWRSLWLLLLAWFESYLVGPVGEKGATCDLGQIRGRPCRGEGHHTYELMHGNGVGPVGEKHVTAPTCHLLVGPLGEKDGQYISPRRHMAGLNGGVQCARRFIKAHTPARSRRLNEKGPGPVGEKDATCLCGLRRVIEERAGE